MASQNKSGVGEREIITSSLTKSDSVLSTESLDSTEMNSSNSFSFAPRDLFYSNPESSEQLCVVRQGKPLPVQHTKNKFKKTWKYALMFRYGIGLLYRNVHNQTF